MEVTKQVKQDIAYIRQYMKASNAATGSKFDSNANIDSKNVVTLGNELHKYKNIMDNRTLMYEKMTSMFDEKLADMYIADILSHRLYKHDETATPGIPYCVAVTLYPFLIEGLTKIGGV